MAAAPDFRCGLLETGGLYNKAPPAEQLELNNFTLKLCLVLFSSPVLAKLAEQDCEALAIERVKSFQRQGATLSNTLRCAALPEVCVRVHAHVAHLVLCHGTPVPSVAPLAPLRRRGRAEWSRAG